MIEAARMRTSTRTRLVWRVSFLGGALTMICACATVPAPPAAEVRSRLGTAAIAPAQYQPQSNFSTYAAGRSAGAAKGVAEGAFGGALVMGAAIASTGGMAAAAFAFIAPYYIVTAAAASSVAGAMKSLPAEKVQEFESALNDTLARLDVQHALADRLARVMSSETSPQLRAVDAKGPTLVGETPTYADLRSAGVDTVVEVGVTRIGFVECETGIYPTYDHVKCPPEAKT